MLYYPAGWRSWTRSVCHREAPPVCLKLAGTSVALRAGHITVVPTTPGTDGTCGCTRSSVHLFPSLWTVNYLRELQSRHTTRLASAALVAKYPGCEKTPRFSLQSKDPAHPFACRLDPLVANLQSQSQYET